MTCPTNCSQKYGRKLCPHYNLVVSNPELVQEWDYEQNDKTPEWYSPGSHAKVGWRCSQGHEWKTIIKNRTKRNQPCPHCTKRIPSPSYNLKILHPKIALEWDFSKNHAPPGTYLPQSNAVVWWKCKLFGHEWQESICNRTRQGRHNCPYCSNHRVSLTNNLTIKYPHLLIEWHPTKNKLTPNCYMSKSHEVVWWMCDKNHEWRTRISHRTYMGSGCPHCASQQQASKIALQWLAQLAIALNRPLQTAASPEGEYQIPGTEWWADGYDPSTNTIYEFHGDYWHGNPRKYKPQEMNLTVGKTHGQLYAKTQYRTQKLRQMGYTVIEVWEDEYQAYLKQQSRITHHIPVVIDI